MCTLGGTAQELYAYDQHATGVCDAVELQTALLVDSLLHEICADASHNIIDDVAVHAGDASRWRSGHRCSSKAVRNRFYRNGRGAQGLLIRQNPANCFQYRASASAGVRTRCYLLEVAVARFRSVMVPNPTSSHELV